MKGDYRIFVCINPNPKSLDIYYEKGKSYGALAVYWAYKDEILGARVIDKHGTVRYVSYHSITGIFKVKVKLKDEATRSHI